MVIVMIGEIIRNIKCQILLIRSFLIFTLYAIYKPIIKGATSANASNSHFAFDIRFVNCALKKTTVSSNTPVTNAPAIRDFLLLVTSKLFIKKFLIIFKNLKIYGLKLSFIFLIFAVFIVISFRKKADKIIYRKPVKVLKK